MPTFQVKGPYEVPTYPGRAAKIVDFERLGEFWSSTDGLGTARGVYVFAVRAGRGARPIYVGKATNTFKQEVFTPHKLEKYQRCLADFRKGTPILYFLCAPSSRGALNRTAVRELEDFLIQTAVSRNPGLLNVRGTKREDWAIAGVVRSGVGKPSKAARGLKSLLGL
jgi:hypothetical protein